MKNKLISFITTAVLGLTFAVSSAAQETPTLATVWTCNFKDGKSMEDLEAWADFWSEQVDRIGADEFNDMRAVAWTPIMAGAQFDVIWLEYHDNLNSFARGAQTYNASPLSVPVETMWEGIVDCENSHHFRTNIFQGDNVEINDPATIETFRCRFHPGKSMIDVEQALVRWTNVLGDVGATQRFVAYMFTPFHSTSGFDVSYYGVYDSMVDYAQSTTDFLTSVQGQAMNNEWNSIHRCESSLFTGNRIIPED